MDQLEIVDVSHRRPPIEAIEGMTRPHVSPIRIREAFFPPPNPPQLFSCGELDTGEKHITVVPCGGGLVGEDCPSELGHGEFKWREVSNAI